MSKILAGQSLSAYCCGLREVRIAVFHPGSVIAYPIIFSRKHTKRSHYDYQQNNSHDDSPFIERASPIQKRENARIEDHEETYGYSQCYGDRFIRRIRFFQRIQYEDENGRAKRKDLYSIHRCFP